MNHISSMPHLASRIFGTPLLIHPRKLDVILSVLGPRLGLAMSDDSQALIKHLAAQAPPVNSTALTSNIAVISVSGTLVRRAAAVDAASGLTSYTAISAQLAQAVRDPAINAILLDIDSPGGEAGGAFDLADQIMAARQIKPIWAVANDDAFSAAYAIASAASRVYITRTGGVGSVGVIALHVDQSQRDAMSGLRYTAVYAGDRKNDMSPHAPLSTDAAQALRGKQHQATVLLDQGVGDTGFVLAVDGYEVFRGLHGGTIAPVEVALLAHLHTGDHKHAVGACIGAGGCGRCVLAAVEALHGSWPLGAQALDGQWWCPDRQAVRHSLEAQRDVASSLGVGLLGAADLAFRGHGRIDKDLAQRLVVLHRRESTGDAFA